MKVVDNFSEACIGCFTQYLTENGLKFEATSTEVAVAFTGECFPVSVAVKADLVGKRVIVYCELPFTIKKEKMVELVMATSYINQVISVGKFCINTDTGALSYQNYELSGYLSGFNIAYAQDILMSAFSVIERYSDRLFAVNNSCLTVKEFAAKL